jgi:hypothetical protein
MLHIWFLLFLYIRTCTSFDSLTSNQFLKDGQTLVSSDGTFELGFFSPRDSTNRYLGLWFRNVSPQTLVWVANRESPLNNSRGFLRINSKGVLIVLNGTNSTTVWSSNVTTKEVNNPIARVLDSGNLVVQNGKNTKEDHFLWQSFDYLCDTLLLNGTKLGWDLVTGHEIFLSSWKKNDDPAIGEYSLRIYRKGYPQLFKFKGLERKFRIGSWNGVGFSGYPTLILKQLHRFRFVFDEKQVYIESETLDRSIMAIYRLTPLGHGELSVRTSKTRNWRVISTGEEDECENYALCGTYSICIMDGNFPTCECMKGYVPKFPKQWNISYWSNGCVPKNKSNCENSYKDGFLRYSKMKLPDTSSSLFSKIMDLEECRNSCLENCSCSAYANLDIRNGGSGCLLWFDELVDVRKFSQWGQDLYVRVPASQLGTNFIYFPFVLYFTILLIDWCKGVNFNSDDSSKIF